jgi:hypothetical protein
MTEMMMFVGVGGSGAKTLAYLHGRLTAWASERGWDRPLPEAWQFLAIDLPKELEDAERIGHALPRSAYRSIAPGKRPYSSYDARLAGSGLVDVRREYATWRPDSKKVSQTVSKGAGQYRAIGRVVVIESFGTVAKAVDGAVRMLTKASTESAFDQFLSAVGLPPRGAAPSPLVFVIGSVAGGSGSGTVLDVCDLIRAKGDGGDLWLQDVSSILYMPEVFETLSETEIRGVEANSLAAVNELISARYNGDVPLPHLTAAGVAGRPEVSRGPRYPFFVGRTNGVFGYPDDHGVYAGTARILEALTLDRGLQGAFVAATLGNFAQSENIEDNNPLRPGHTVKPASALGYARLSLGRDVFSRYLAERVSKSLVNHLLHAHEALALAALGEGADLETLDRTKMVDAVVTEDLFTLFIEAAKLNERSQYHNQVLERLLPPADRKALVDGISTTVLKATRSGQRGNHPGLDWFTRFETQLGIYEEQLLVEVRKVLQRNAAILVETLPAQLLATTRTSLATHGLFVTERLLANLDAALLKVVNEELPSERSQLLSGADGLVSNVRQGIAGLMSKEIRFDNDALAKAFDDILAARPSSRAMVETRDVAIPLLRDFRASVLVTLRTSLRLAGEELVAFSATSAFEDWAGVAVPDRLKPPGNEIAVEPLEGFPETFDRLVRQAVGVQGDPTRAVIERLLDDEQLPTKDRDRLSLLRITDWASGARTDAVDTTVRFGPSELIDRARAWALSDPTGGLGAFLTESLGSYLDGTGLTKAGRDDRIRVFCQELDRAIRAAQPMVDIDEAALGALHNEGLNDAGLPPTKLAITPIPVPAANVNARRAIDAVLLSYGVQADGLAGYYATTTSATSIAVTTQAQPCHPLAIRSFTDGILSKWIASADPSNVFGHRRRARRLLESVPLPHDSVRRLMRGWIAGSLVGLAGYDGPENASGEVTSVDSVWVCGKDGSIIPLPTAGPEGRARDAEDVLAMLLDAYAISELLAVTGDGSIAGYERLAELAELGEVREWVQLGSVANQVVDDIEHEADESDNIQVARAKVLTAELSAMESEYRTLIDTMPTIEYSLMTRRWDLAEDLLAVVTDLRASIEGMAQTTSRPRRRRVGA